jgi:tRNA (cytidine56-2'-O)-methyltransferase
MSQISSSQRDIMVVVGSQKVPGEFFSEEFSDYNISIGAQPHSEVAALAIFLDRLLEGSELSKEFEQARIKVIPSQREKRLIKAES